MFGVLLLIWSAGRSACLSSDVFWMVRGKPMKRLPIFISHTNKQHALLKQFRIAVLFWKLNKAVTFPGCQACMLVTFPAAGYGCTHYVPLLYRFFIIIIWTAFVLAKMVRGALKGWQMSPVDICWRGPCLKEAWHSRSLCQTHSTSCTRGKRAKSGQFLEDFWCCFFHTRTNGCGYALDLLCIGLWYFKCSAPSEKKVTKEICSHSTYKAQAGGYQSFLG